MRSTRPESEQPALASAYGDWRRRRLMAAGFTPTLACRLSQDDEIDLHELLVLVDLGCPPELAARILAPLELAATTS
ncbi:MAG TPA: hypothetical protein VGF63_07160 [Solirubrobacteraceae bacterium]|jgi:hypothetical protein